MNSSINRAKEPNVNEIKTAGENKDNTAHHDNMDGKLSK